MTGPYETERQARADVEHVHGEAALRQHLIDACQTAGVTLGAYDLRIISWLAGWEPETVQVVVGLIQRARQSGFDN